MEIKIASRSDVLQASNLVAENYKEKGYLPTLEERSAWIEEILCKDIVHRNTGSGLTLVAKEGDEVIGTVMLEFNPSELSLDKLFPEEMKKLRASGKSFVYFGAFATAKEYSCTRTSMRMLREQWKIIQEMKDGPEIGICGVHPDHAGCYERFGFEVLATQNNMPGLTKAPVTLLVIQRDKVKKL